MSYFEDYIEDGLCCEQCGEFMGGDEPRYVRVCASCEGPRPWNESDVDRLARELHEQGLRK